MPDFLVRMDDGGTLVLEIEGQDSDQDRARRAALGRWVEAVNAKGGFGRWRSAVAFRPEQVHDLLAGVSDVAAA